MRDAIVQIVVADLSMSLDNVLAVAGVARDHTWVLVVGLVLSVAFMGLAAAWIARMLEHRPGSPTSGWWSSSMWRWR